MTLYLLALVLLGLSLFGIALRKTYNHLPRKELKRQARGGDRDAAVLYRAVAYGASLRLLLWLWIGLTAAAGFLLLVEVAPAPLAFLAVAGLLWFGFVWLPNSRISGIGARLVIAVTPAIAWLLSLLHPVLNHITNFVAARRPVTFHTGLYEREDLVELMELQRQMPGSRIAPAEIDIVMHALTFGEVPVQAVMVPRRSVVMVAESDIVGPVLMHELHDSGYSRYPVYGVSEDQIIGTLYVHDMLEAKQGGTVGRITRRDVYYVHEDQTLYQVLHAFLKTKHHLFIVVNSFEEFVGIITIEDVLEQVIGRKIEDEFDRYDDIRAVAANHSGHGHGPHKSVPDIAPEVVE